VLKRNLRGLDNVDSEEYSTNWCSLTEMSVAHFNKDLTVEQAFKTHAGARRVFAKFHLGGCSNCSISETETVEQVSEGYGIPLDMLLAELEQLFDQPSLEVGDLVRLPDEIRAKIPQLATVPEIGKVAEFAAGAYIVEFGEVRLQGLAEDFIKAEPATANA
jgi:hybrid cluster-associated redox disulfide protein